ncbi:MAG: hypothetical protein ACHRXM_01665, partial [Isosphaerales bacterium]
ALKPALSLQFQRLEPPPLAPVNRQDVRWSHPAILPKKFNLLCATVSNATNHDDRARNTMVNPSSNDEAIDNPLKDEGPVEVLLRPHYPAARHAWHNRQSSRRHDGRVVSLTRVRTAPQNDHDTRNPMADEEFGPEPETQENP